MHSTVSMHNSFKLIQVQFKLGTNNFVFIIKNHKKSNKLRAEAEARKSRYTYTHL